jgi:uncharacterized membrane protein YhaH (DUF805 family)
VQWYLEVLRNYAKFEGRAHRTEFWLFVLVNVAISLALSILDRILGTDGDYGGLLQGVYGLAVLVPSLAVGARRLHDIGRSGWWQLLSLTVVGIIVLIVWWAKEGEKAPNSHGPDPWAGPQPV